MTEKQDTMKMGVLNTDAIRGTLEDIAETEMELDKGAYMLRVLFHSAMIVLTKGIWIFVFTGYHLYQHWDGDEDLFIEREFEEITE